MKPVIGVMPLWDDEKDSLWMLPGYPDGIIQAGGLPFIFPFTEDKQDLDQLADLCDGFLFTGGHDVSPDLYHEEPLPGLVSCCRKRDEMEIYILKKAIDADKPILGICRGIQLINVALGGTLYQDLPSQHPSETTHHQHAPYDIPAHEVILEAGLPLHDCLDVRQLSVNSCHHQAVKKIADSLKAMAVSPDGLTEALYRPGSRYLWAVQWHPEFSYRTDESSRKIFSSFVSAAMQYTVQNSSTD